MLLDVVEQIGGNAAALAVVADFIVFCEFGHGGSKPSPMIPAALRES